MNIVYLVTESKSCRAKELGAEVQIPHFFSCNCGRNQTDFSDIGIQNDTAAVTIAPLAR